MSRFFRREPEPRRNTDEDFDKMQYYTPRGIVPARVAEQQVQEAAINPATIQGNRLYPHHYRNSEANGTSNFKPHEQRNDPDNRQFYEVPINSRINLAKPPASVERIRAVEENLHRNDRGRVVKNELNDPGVFRGVVTGNRTTGENFGLVGVTYHPEDRPRALRRAPMEPLDREGRQFLRRFDDDAADPHRVTTWPPRDEDASELQAYEERYKQVRRPRPPQQQKLKQKVPNAN
ncbi:hypothetical protein H9Q69_005440 [Fusarium xylarioides]|uniref:Uncharacterized protein n=1 Tax=Fusarium xylarioides TaxID=221167 RepID=A0A9P7HNP4_9HYPO|nr:hypothetical protein H9Q70_012339 [Fusarium xylarioides]KAG5759437.1 hypothetical protein H9Q72_012446 [Fusarium xylarioides]KAG5780245.1 hypothetical protein H9Q73_006094 [Fusarium xylarioides]KAG5795506.1 hypothetical protein H9Q69_005440 [Fusarium xylarioides]